jgi:hypothetical protein
MTIKGQRGSASRNRRLFGLMLLACGLLLVSAPAAFAAAPTCNDDPFEETQAGAQDFISFDCTPGSGLTYTVVSPPSHGALDQSDIANGDVSYVANNNFTGTDTFTFKAINSSSQDSNIATVTIAVDPENECFPDEGESTPSGTPLLVSLECSSGTVATETFSIVNAPSHGALGTIDQANAQVTYTPSAGFSGTDTFSYHAFDGVMTAATVTVTIHVGNACSDQTITTVVNSGPPPINLDCTSATGGVETFSIVGQPSHGKLSGFSPTDGTVQYTPTHGFTGSDSFTFKANDGAADSNTATVTINVTPPPPECVDVDTTTPENTAVTIPLRCVSPSGDTMTLNIEAGQGPDHGTLGTISQAAQTVTYTPTASFQGADDFAYTATDSHSDTSDDAFVSIQVGITCNPEPPNTNQGSPVTIGLNCSGPTGVPLTLAINSPPAHGTLGAIDQNGQQITYTPAAGYHGSDSFTFHASGGGGSSAVTTVTITVNPASFACFGSETSTGQNQPVTVPISCVDRSGAPITLSTAAGGAPSHGQLAFNNTNQTVTYTPTTGFTGDDEFTYSASDGASTATATIEVTVGISCATVTPSTPVGHPITIPLDCVGPDGTPLTLSIGTAPTHGALGQIDASSQTVQYTPAAAYAGQDTFTYMATGGGQASALATATITMVAPVPECSDIHTSTAPDTPVTISLECSGPEGTTLTLTTTVQPSNGTLGAVDSAARTVTYTPDSGFVGSDSFGYRAVGGGQTSDDAEVRITVGPTCFDNLNFATENQPVELSLECVGPRGQTLTLSTTSSPAHGTLGPIDSGNQQVLYAPSNNYIGPDAFTYEATAGTSTSNVAVESIDVEPPSTQPQPAAPPTCQSASAATAQGAPVSIPLTCTDPNGRTLTLTAGSPNHGTLGAITQGASPTVVYTPVAGYTGSDDFAYLASNGDAVSETQFISIQVGLTCGTVDSSGQVGAAQQIDLDCAGPGTLTYHILSGPSHGSLGGISADGSVTYTPTGGYHGPDSFTYDTTSGGATSNTATAIVTVSSSAPSCSDISASTAESTAVAVPLTCTEAGGATLTLLIPSISSEPQHGTLGTIDQVNKNVTYTPATGFEGTDTFSYAATDGSETSETATVAVTVGLSCDDDSEQVAENQPLTIDLSCVAPSGTTPMIAVAGPPAHGTLLSLDQTHQTIVYTPNNNFTGTDSFTIQASGGGQTSQTAVISLDVTPAPPACDDVNVSTPAATAVSVPLHCTVVGGATLTLSIAPGDGPDNGTLGTIDQATQKVTYTPNAGFQGSDSFGYRASDGSQTSQEALVQISVGTAPTCSDVPSNTDAGSAKLISLACSAGTYSIVSQPGHGTLSGLNSATGAVTYTPNAGFSGTDTFTYMSTQSSLQSNTATVTITVTAATPAAPACSNESASTDNAHAVTVSLHCVDAAGRALTLASVQSPSHGALGSVNQTAQTVAYTPAAGFVGTDTFTYSAVAGSQSSNVATVTITVTASGGGGGGGGGGGPLITSIHVAGTAKVSKSGVASVLVTFTGNGQGTLTLTGTVTKKHKKTKATIGTASVTLTNSGTATVSVHLNGTGKSLLKKGHGKLTAGLTITFLANAHGTVTGKVKLSGPAPHKHKH